MLANDLYTELFSEELLNLNRRPMFGLSQAQILPYDSSLTTIKLEEYLLVKISSRRENTSYTWIAGQLISTNRLGKRPRKTEKKFFKYII